MGLGVLGSLLLVLVVFRIGERPRATTSCYWAWQAAHVEILQVLRNE
jgi:hypothetical protein